MPEARRSKRVRTILGVKIVFNNRMSVMDCAVKNISSSGAKLVLPDTLRVPNEFELYIPKRRCFYYARLIRHESECIGVKFYHADAKMAPDPHLSEFET